MTIQLVAAMDKNRALGKNGDMAWHIPEELRHFKTLTLGGVVIMGRVTFESIGRPLPGRVSIIVSKTPTKATHSDTHWVESIDAALAMANNHFPQRKVWIGGGANVYAQTLHLASDLHLSVVPLEVQGADVFFPSVDPTQWELVETQKTFSDIDGALLFTYNHYTKVYA